MKIKSLSLFQFRNYDNLLIEFNPGLNIIVGDNAQGKTNLLEAVYFMSTLRSFRTQSDKDLINFNQDYFKIQCEVESELSQKNCQVVVLKTGKSIKVNHNMIKKSSEYIGLINCVSFSPQDLNFFSDSPKVRRKFLDIECTKLSKEYLFYLNNYFSGLKQRNALLKQPAVDEDVLMILTKQLIDDMWMIESHRHEIVQFLNQRAELIFRELTHSEKKLEFQLQSDIVSENETEFKQKMMEKMMTNKTRDLYFKITHAGCHRDDLMTRMDGVEINSIASQGQKRLVLISMKLALIEYITYKLKETPILLLDDVFSELDQTHQHLFLKHCPQQIQTIISTTSVENLHQLNRPMTLFEIKQGQLLQRSTING